MLLALANLLHHYFHALWVVHYLTFRTILSILTALIISLGLGPVLIKKLQAMQIGQPIRDDGPQTHLVKTGTPTMGGALILSAVVLSTLLWGDLNNRYVWVVLIVTVAFGAIGWVDDYRKLVLKNSKGLSARSKFFWQAFVALGVAIYLFVFKAVPAETQLLIPFIKNTFIELGWFYPIFTFFVIVGTSNAVNLTDGLDGLAIVPIAMIAGALGIFAYASGHAQYSHYLAIPAIPGVGEITVFCGAIVGASLGFLWFNAYPAQVFMGDVGALGLGAALGIIAVLVRQELVLMIMGGLFVAETLSVILQVASFKMTGRRIFRMAPLHHHFELQGWPEPKVIVRLWIVTVVLVLCGLATLKLR